MNDDVPNRSFALTALQARDFYRMQVREVREYAMFVLDPGGILKTWNAGVGRLLGYTEQEWIGQHASMIFLPEDTARETCESEMRTAEETGSAVDIRWHRHKDGTQFFANGFMTALRDEKDVLIGYAKILSDETARKHLQDSLTESNTALEQFAYVASHDLQEPLRTIGIYAELLTRKYGGKLDSEADEYLAFIVGTAGRMSSLVQDLLAYARLTTEEDRPSSIALDDDLAAALTHLDPVVKESGASITNDPLPMLKVDRGRMVRLFQNLIGNAIKYRAPDRPPRCILAPNKKGKNGLSQYATTESASIQNTHRLFLRHSSDCTPPRSIRETVLASQFAAVS